MKRSFAAILLIVAVLMLAGCGSGIEGSWKLTGGTAVAALYADPALTPEAAGVELIFRFADDGAFSIVTSGGASAEGASGTWTEDGDRLTITISGESSDCTYSIDGDKLTLIFTYEGQNVSFEFKKA